MLTLAELAAPLAQAVTATPVPLLVLRADGPEDAALMAFSQTCAGTLRADDLPAHDPSSNRFVVAMLSAARRRRLITPRDCRSAVQRLGAMVSLKSCAPVETGWTMLYRLDSARDVHMQVQAALARGVRERERYDFFTAIGHELRTPLTSIRGYLDTLLESETDGATARRFLETARGEALRMSRMVDGMFAFSLLDLSACELPERGCGLLAQAELACDIMTPLARERGVSLRATGCDRTAASIESDACLQLLANLIENAIKFGHPGGRVYVTVRRNGEHAEIFVDDDGPGVSPCDRASIFGFRVRGSQTSRAAGTGIGLAMVKIIAERDGGGVSVCDSPLGGARFAVVLPRWAESAPSAS